MLRGDILLFAIRKDLPNDTIRENDFLDTRRMMRLCLSIGKVEHFNTISVGGVPGVHLLVVVFHTPCMKSLVFANACMIAVYDMLHTMLAEATKIG